MGDKLPGRDRHNQGRWENSGGTEANWECGWGGGGAPTLTEKLAWGLGVCLTEIQNKIHFAFLLPFAIPFIFSCLPPTNHTVSLSTLA